MATAWLEWNEHLYWASYARHPFEPQSAVFSLIDGVWRKFPNLAHFILRGRIFVDEEPTALCRGTVAVCAKRISRVVQVPSDIQKRMISDPKAICVNHGSQLQAGSLFQDESTQPYRYLRDRSIECWLIGGDGRLLGSAVNSAGRNRTQHAEMNLLRSWWQREHRPLPRDARLVTTLEPCPMCAGAIWESLESHDTFRVIYLEPDLGTSVRRSVLRGTRILERCTNFKHCTKS